MVTVKKHLHRPCGQESFFFFFSFFSLFSSPCFSSFFTFLNFLLKFAYSSSVIAVAGPLSAVRRPSPEEAPRGNRGFNRMGKHPSLLFTLSNNFLPTGPTVVWAGGLSSS